MIPLRKCEETGKACVVKRKAVGDEEKLRYKKKQNASSYFSNRDLLWNMCLMIIRSSSAPSEHFLVIYYKTNSE